MTTTLSFFSAVMIILICLHVHLRAKYRSCLPSHGVGLFMTSYPQTADSVGGLSSALLFLFSWFILKMNGQGAEAKIGTMILVFTGVIMMMGFICLVVSVSEKLIHISKHNIQMWLFDLDRKFKQWKADLLVNGGDIITSYVLNGISVAIVVIMLIDMARTAKLIS